MAKKKAESTKPAAKADEQPAKAKSTTKKAPAKAKAVTPKVSPMEVLSAGQTFVRGLRDLFEHEKVLEFEKKIKKALSLANANRKKRLSENKDKKDKDRYVGFADAPLQNTQSNYRQTEVGFDINEANYPAFLRVWSQFEKPESRFNEGMVQFMINRGVQFPQTKGNRFLYTEFVPNDLIAFLEDFVVKEEDNLYLFVAAYKFAVNNSMDFEPRRSKVPEQKGEAFSL